MNNYNYTRPPRKGVIVFVSFVFAAIFGIAFFSAYEQRTDLGHSVHISPTSANYGTVSTARPQGLVVPMQSSAPMLTGGAIRSYAYSGHATMPKSSGSTGAGFKIHTTSSASLHSYGSGSSGAGGVGGAMSSNGGSTASSRGIHATGGSYAMPSLALTTPSYTVEVSSPAHMGLGRRRVHDDGAGGMAGDYDGENYNGQWWNEDDQEWVDDPFYGCRRYNETTGRWEVYNGSGWVNADDQGDPTNTPIGDAPWLWILLLAVGYGGFKLVRKKHKTI